MKSDLITYIRQRFNPLLFAGLALFLLLLSFPLQALNGISLLLFVVILWLLFILRLFDDVMQSENDQKKPNRNYTEAAVKKRLGLLVALLMVVTVIGVSCFDFFIGLVVAAFFVINGLAYRLLVHKKIYADLLPFVKYPCIFLLMPLLYGGVYHVDLSITFRALALFFSLLVFESIDDRTFSLPLSIAPLFQAVSFLFLFLLQPDVFIGGLTGAAVVVSVAATKLNVRFFQYGYLLLFLTTKLIIDVL